MRIGSLTAQKFLMPQKNANSANFCGIKDVFTRKKQILKNDEYFIHLGTHYHENPYWAEEMSALTYKISDMISADIPFEKILSEIENGVRKINHFDCYGLAKDEDYDLPFDLEKLKRGGRYLPEYFKTLDGRKTLKIKSNDEYRDAKTCLLEDMGEYIRIHYGFDDKDPMKNLKLAEREYEKLKKIKKPNPQEVNKSCATIQWLISQEAPYVRGNDSIANLLTKSIYHANRMTISPCKKDKSFDFEAFNCNLDDYIKKYPEIFEKAPKKQSFRNNKVY